MNSRPPFEGHRGDMEKVLRILQDTPAIDREYMAPTGRISGARSTHE